MWLPDEGTILARETPLLVAASGWLVYTRLYFFLQPRHLTVDASLFMLLFNKPDPGCGLTRTFAWMWRGDLVRALLVYPLGPLAFVAVVLLVVYCTVAIISRRRLALTLSTRTWHWIFAFVGIAVGLNWASKLIWLGM